MGTARSFIEPANRSSVAVGYFFDAAACPAAAVGCFARAFFGGVRRNYAPENLTAEWQASGGKNGGKMNTEAAENENFLSA
jgi:hypothetical protein